MSANNPLWFKDEVWIGHQVSIVSNGSDITWKLVQKVCENFRRLDGRDGAQAVYICSRVDDQTVKCIIKVRVQ
jgi:hypothetical protein